MDVLLVNPPFLPAFSRSQRSPGVTKGGTLYYPIWLAYAAGHLEKKGFDVFLVDAVAENLSFRDIRQLAINTQPLLIVIETSTPSIQNDLNFARKLKLAFPKIFITLVGTHVSVLDKETLRSSKFIDFVVRGEYELTLAQLADAIKNSKSFRPIRGLTYRKGKRIIRNAPRLPIQNLDALPFVSSTYKKFLVPTNYSVAFSFYPMVQIFTGRGCPFHCFYCLYPQVMHGHKYRTRSIANVVEEFNFIKHSMPEIKEVVIEDDTFTADISRVREFCSRLIKSHNTLKWNVNARVNLDSKTLKLMKKAGCRLIVVGFESGNQEILNNIPKGTRLRDSQLLIKKAHRIHLLIHGCFIYGLPGETKETIRQTFKFACHLNPDSAQFYPLFVYPGTQAYDWAVKEKLLRTNDFRKWLTTKGNYQGMVNLPHLSSREITKLANDSYWRYLFRPSFLARKFIWAINNPTEGLRELKVLFKYLKTFRR
jgi:anaerobic magnesium-protoporphyrin IX monomethyl ester cyclase